MKRYLNVLFIQGIVICVVAGILEMFFAVPNVVSVVIASFCFVILAMKIQIGISLYKADGSISSDGIAGARLFGIILISIILPWVLGVFQIIVVDICMLILAIICMYKGRKKILSFFSENRWEMQYWFVLLGGVLGISGIYSILSCYDIAPCGTLNGVWRVIGVLGIMGIMKISLPTNSPMAKFATSNYEHLH